MTQTFKTAEQREEEFRADFELLLKIHGADFDVTDDGESYGLHRGVARVSMNAKWDKDGNHIAAYTEFDL